MAAETFAFNHLGIDLNTNDTHANASVQWIKSDYPRCSLNKRLRENPYESLSGNEKKYSDISVKSLKANAKLVIGSIIELNNFLDEQLEGNPELQEKLSVDLVSGGPPCQSFSMAGLRQKDNHRNRLPWEFARFVNHAKPKIVLLENVSGILRAFHQDGNEYHAWKEVAKAFSSIGYAPICIHANAKYVGVPQNRPRFLMFAIRKDLLKNISNADFTNEELKALNLAIRTLSKNFNWEYYRYWDVTNIKDSTLFNGKVFSSLRTHSSVEQWVPSKAALRDFERSPDDTNLEYNYAENINKLFGNSVPRDEIKNTQLRKHGERVKQRFRLYQALETIGERSLVSKIKNTHKTNYIEATELASSLSNEKLLFANENTLRVARDSSEIVELILGLATKKHSQRALVAEAPAPAALSIPDDCCHYSSNELRTLSVREVARLQSFPDSFEFRSKVTTGGENRKFEVPQYTQAGNAVPPLLARSAAIVVEQLIHRLTKTEQASS